MMSVNCPVRENSTRVVEISGEMIKAIRRLRRSLKACPGCPFADGCRFWQGFKSQVEAAVRQVNQELGLVKREP